MIYVDCRLISKKNTGISNFILNISKRLGSSDVYFIVNEYDSRLPTQQLIVDFKPFNFFHTIKFTFWLNKYNPDVYLSLFYSGSLLSFHSIKNMTVVHDLMYKFVPGFFGSKVLDFIGRTYFNFIVNPTIKNSDVLFSVSQSTKSDLYRLFKKDSIVIGEGTTLNVVEHTHKKRCFSVPFFLYVGNARPHKGLDDFISGYKIYKDKGGKKSLVIVGNDKEFNVEGVISLGYVDDVKLSELYHEASALVFPSLYEGFGLPILDALNHKTPVLCNDIPAFREFEHSNVFFFETHSAANVAEVLTVDANFDELTAERILNRFDWMKTTEIIKKTIYEN